MFPCSFFKKKNFAFVSWRWVPLTSWKFNYNSLIFFCIFSLFVFWSCIFILLVGEPWRFLAQMVTWKDKAVKVSGSSEVWWALATGGLCWVGLLTISSGHPDFSIFLWGWGRLEDCLPVFWKATREATRRSSTG